MTDQKAWRHCDTCGLNTHHEPTCVRCDIRRKYGQPLGNYYEHERQERERIAREGKP